MSVYAFYLKLSELNGLFIYSNEWIPSISKQNINKSIYSYDLKIY